MKSLLALAASLLLLPQNAAAQGHFQFKNSTAPTRMGSLDGALAGRGVWAQALVGATPVSLAPLGTTVEHRNGLIGGHTRFVPGGISGDIVYVQLAAWDGSPWGTNYAAVPRDQLGFSDVVAVTLVVGLDIDNTSLFTQPAIVPIAEPSSVALTGLGLALLALGWRRSGERGAT